MTKATPAQIRKLAGLSQLTELALEARLADLRKAARARDATKAALAELAGPRSIPNAEVSLAAFARADLLYDRWVERRRSEMNLQLARQTAIWLEQRSTTALAFGRNDVLTKLTDQLRNQLSMQSKRS